MLDSQYIENSTIFVEYTNYHAVKTDKSGLLNHPTHDLLLLYALGHKITIPPIRGQGPSVFSQISYLDNYSSHHSFLKKHYHEQFAF